MRKRLIISRLRRIQDSYELGVREPRLCSGNGRHQVRHDSVLQNDEGRENDAAMAQVAQVNQNKMNASPQDFEALVMAVRLVMAKWAVGSFFCFDRVDTHSRCGRPLGWRGQSHDEAPDGE